MSQLDPAAIVEGLFGAPADQQRPITVHAVTFDGVQHTQPSVLQAIAQPVLAATTPERLLAGTQAACARIQGLGIARDLQLRYDAARDADGHYVPDGVVVAFDVAEAPRYAAKSGTEIGNQDSNLNTAVTTRNAFGYAEQIDFNYSYGVPLNKGAAYNVHVRYPIAADPRNQLHVDVQKSARSRQTTASHDLALLTASVKQRQDRPDGRVETRGVAAALRHITQLAPSACWDIRRQAGYDVKAALTHSVEHDRRNDPMLPTGGHYWRVDQELAATTRATGAANGHYRAESTFLQTFLLHRGWVSEPASHHGRSCCNDGPLGGHSRLTPLLGLLLPFRSAVATHYDDRFHLGGPLSLRGFRVGGVGPQSGRDVLGGNAFWAAGLSLITPLPGLPPDAVLRGHVFANAGACTARARDLLATAPSCAVGYGLLCRFSVLRLELNYVVPLVHRASEQRHPGLQFGIGIQFL
ncbi:hypothetical protein CXG81DRAFT_12676 [Caulochytrium protostelioides]|uniref:Bacterial surface antigen (D15) domain-containing protein n=1 Tax=Caulochytrium protostelioides TaxID=1555241 RepID=A0A4P9X6U2_9FUNG|nr:hypothetical protein CXG81DRAFT_12676 [Caulochytrium protostelioides]|eukprot:RKP00892.1 hypothetical protein CXG81DRAFT_12676 [Caulochytrium protostelioides]